MSKQDIIIDSPKKRLEDDLFGWEPVVNRISDIIRLKSSDNHPCFTIGIYGKWGEGKSSLMNMVCENIKKEENIEVIHFNPWLFKDQESLLLDFFKTLQKGNLSNEFVKKIKQYGPMVSLGISGLFNLALPGVGTLIKNSLNEYIDAVSSIEIDVTKLKEEVNDSICLSKKHLLIVIDDVDRLDRDELHALFKLIRQNADFVNTTYMVAMDVDMVAKSIGQRFEDGDEQSGKNFLEKIIQVPFHLPKIQQGHIYKLFEMYLFPRLDEILKESGASTTLKDDIHEAFVSRIIPLFTTVRDVIVYTNSLLLTLPLIYRDVNISDFCQLEALKMFHPKAYDRIKNGKHFLTEPIYVRTQIEAERDRLIKEVKNKFIDELMEGVL
ncbi:MAG TPA: P-loop NTPase fold protein, partial [Fermentimonas sp.]|nr:P-loop NTPase fold protein [Fermentimonas sp.]